MKKYLILTGLMIWAGGLAAQDFTNPKIVHKCPVSSVKNQGKTGTCWSFSTTSFIESEAMRLGKETADLSEMYFVRKTYPDKIEKYVRLHGNQTFGQGGLAHDVLNSVRRHGLVPEEAYSGLNKNAEGHDHSALFRELKKTAKAAAGGKTEAGWKAKTDSVLDAKLGKVPAKFEFKGKEFTPAGFAEHIGFVPDNYIQLTSYVHHDFYRTFSLEVPDNWSDGQFFNLPVDEMMRTMEFALRNGHSLVWDGDVSEKGFSHSKGYAVLKTEKSVDQELRQKTFDDRTTTDDHLMHITGLVRDENGETFYLTKNSWGKSNAFEGFLYMSENYVRLKTVSVMLHKDALPKDIAKKLGL